MDIPPRPLCAVPARVGGGTSGVWRALRKVGRLGCSVIAPPQPGFGRTPALDGEQCSFPGYARWAVEHLDALGVDQPVIVVGHSFGGGVAIQLAHDYPGRVRGVVLCNAVGGVIEGSEPGPNALVDRTLWGWGRQMSADLLALPSLARVLPAVLSEALPNIVQNPLAMWRVGEFVRHADLTDALAVVARRGTPLTVVWSDRDRLVPHASFKALCSAAQVPGVVVPGIHSWMIVDTDRFADIVLRALVDAGVVEDALARPSSSPGRGRHRLTGPPVTLSCDVRIIRVPGHACDTGGDLASGLRWRLVMPPPSCWCAMATTATPTRSKCACCGAMSTRASWGAPMCSRGGRSMMTTAPARAEDACAGRTDAEASALLGVDGRRPGVLGGGPAGVLRRSRCVARLPPPSRAT